MEELRILLIDFIYNDTEKQAIIQPSRVKLGPTAPLMRCAKLVFEVNGEDLCNEIGSDFIFNLFWAMLREALNLIRGEEQRLDFIDIPFFMIFKPQLPSQQLHVDVYDRYYEKEFLHKSAVISLTEYLNALTEATGRFIQLFRQLNSDILNREDFQQFIQTHDVLERALKGIRADKNTTDKSKEYEKSTSVRIDFICDDVEIISNNHLPDIRAKLVFEVNGKNLCSEIGSDFIFNLFWAMILETLWLIEDEGREERHIPFISILYSIKIKPQLESQKLHLSIYEGHEEKYLHNGVVVGLEEYLEALIDAVERFIWFFGKLNPITLETRDFREFITDYDALMKAITCLGIKDYAW